ncbi:MAG: aspartyl/asparaginyl beta-hydroxylase domain-containing protein [Pseudomonadota bacterium]
MRLTQPLLRLPIRFDAAALAAEIDAFPARAWVPHPNKIPGNEAAMLVTTEGRLIEDLIGPMAPTEFLRSAPYMMEAMAAIGAVWGRCRLMRLSPGAVVPPHVDTHYYWRTHVRIHVPIVTAPEVSFTCRGETVHMAAGECWIFDTFARHHVENGASFSRTHLVLDTVGGEWLWDLIDAAGGESRLIAPGMGEGRPLKFEGLNVTGIMSPWELRYHIAFLREEAEPDPLLGAIFGQLERLAEGWSGVWAQHGASPDGIPAYRQLLGGVERALLAIGGQQVRLRNDLPLYRVIDELLFTVNATLTTPGGAARLRSVGN